MKKFEISGQIREDLGKKATKALRNTDAVPCVLYGGENVVHFTLNNADLRHLIYTPHVYQVALTVGDANYSCVIKDIQFHPVSDAILHIDFQQIFADKPVVMNIPVKLEGFAEGVRAGGKLTLENRYLKVKGLPEFLPDTVGVNINKLGLGQSIYVGSLNFENLELLNAKNAVVASVKLTRAARGAAAAAAAAAKK